ncbi:MAG: hypothetical protein IJU48_02005, partial [Synergistaceae bacterium]|nr:hypothetical protein [Synergistaceae bacterium]
MLAVYDPSGTYSEHAGVVMTSIFENTKSKVIIHLLHDDTLTEDNRKKFIRTAEKYSQQIDFVDVTRYREQIGKDIADFYKYRLTIGALYRLLTWKVLDIDKVIYLDCDIFVNLDILELWKIDVSNHYMAATIDMYFHNVRGFSDVKVQCMLQGSNRSKYICSGVLVMNLKKLRERENLFEDAIDWLKWHPHLAGSADQDAFNSMLHDEIKIIDIKFDYQDVNAKDFSDKIIHAGAGQKLWGGIVNSKLSSLYWKTYLLSAWGENCSIDEIIDRLCEVSANSQYTHKNWKQCMKRVKEGINNMIRRRFTGIITLLVRDVYYRIK